MVFSSLIFLFGFLPLTLLFYYLAPHKGRNLILFGMSLLFYAYGEPIYLFLMLFSLTAAYLFGLRIAKFRTIAPKRAKRAFVASCALTLSLLFFFKYYNFLARTSGFLPQIAGLVLPIGISFYSFQILSYTIDLYRGEIEVQKNYLSFGTYVTLFPQLIAGPIVRYRELDDQLVDRKESLDAFSQGALRFSIGLAKKLLLGDTLAAGYEYYKTLLERNPTALAAWMAILLYTLHLYFDFSGYTDMALGLGRLFGFQLPENFNYPYTATSITDFWRRWHISLSSWFREYLYIPLGGNRKGIFITCRNLLVVWLLTGVWHGAGWNFVLWGLYFGVILILEKLFLLRFLDRLPKAFCHLYTILLVLFGFLLFSEPDLATAGRYFAALFGAGTNRNITMALYQFLHLLPLLFLACLAATPLPKRAVEKLAQKHPKLSRLAPLFCLFLLGLSTAYLVDSTYSPFAYFNF